MGSRRRRGRGGRSARLPPGAAGGAPPSQGCAPQPGSVLPPLPRPRAGNVLFPPLPPRGQRAGRAGLCPTLACSPPPPRPGAAAAAPDSRRPRAGGRWAWAGRARGWGSGERRAGPPAPPGGRAPRGVRAPPAATRPHHLPPPPAGEPGPELRPRSHLAGPPGNGESVSPNPASQAP